MKIIVSGGSGFIGSRLVDALVRRNDYVAVWSRKPGTETRSSVQSFYWDPLQGEPAEESLNDFDAVVHLAGEPVAQRWSPEVKRKIRDSRVEGTRRLVDAISKVPRPPSVLICASATGYYGSRGDEVLTEVSSRGSGFLASVCADWEEAADLALRLGLRVVKVRIGVVLGQGGGALKAMLPAFRAGLGARIGSGRQWMSWIHRDDLVQLLVQALDTPIAGPVNAVSPEPVTNAQFTKALGDALDRKAFLQVPEFALKLLVGEMASVVTASQRVNPAVAEEAGFQWSYRHLGPALRAALA